MAKPKSPLLSLGATGTIADTITFQKRHGITFARKTPIPQYRRSLAQQYQRWDYEDAIFFWRSLSDAQKQAYATAGSRLHLTAYAYCIRYYLRNLPDLIGRWRLDYITGAIQPDTSKQGNHGIVYGASPTTGLIDGCLSFDGLNDYVDCGTSPSLNLVGAFTLEFLIYPYETGIEKALFTRLASIYGAIQMITSIRITGANHFGYYNPNSGWKSFTTVLASFEQWQHIAYAYDGTNLRVFKDGVPSAPQATAPPTSQPTYYTYLGGPWGLTNYPQAFLDEVHFRNRLLSDAQILNHSQRRYP